IISSRLLMTMARTGRRMKASVKFTLETWSCCPGAEALGLEGSSPLKNPRRARCVPLDEVKSVRVQGAEA
ncbi:MAG: hypothetical protein V3T64_14840, partial [Myxococcota bacterium]